MCIYIVWFPEVHWLQMVSGMRQEVTTCFRCVLYLAAFEARRSVRSERQQPMVSFIVLLETGRLMHYLRN